VADVGKEGVHARLDAAEPIWLVSQSTISCSQPSFSAQAAEPQIIAGWIERN
jgi:1,2-phenylacetyl-CoA epoxidase PaaB subunit